MLEINGNFVDTNRTENIKANNMRELCEILMAITTSL